jgi:hypothetical protein
MGWWGIDLVGVDVVSKRLVDSLTEAGEQLGQGFASAADQHGQAVMSVGGSGNTTDRAEHAQGDFPVGNQLRDVGQRSHGSDCGVLRNGLGV